MTVREKIHARIEQIDDAALPELLQEIEDFERRMKSDFPPEFLTTIRDIQERHDDLSSDEAADLAGEAVAWARRSRQR